MENRLINYLDSTVGCCYRCEEKRNRLLLAVPEPTHIPINQGYKDTSMLLVSIRNALPVKLRAWRERVWEKEWKRGNVIPEFILSDKMISTIAKSHETLNTVDDFTKLEYQWKLRKRYGASAFAVIVETREEVEENWAANQRRLLEKSRQGQEKREAKKRAAIVEAEARKKQKLDEMRRKKREVELAKWNEYTAKVNRGERPRGRAPRQPSPSSDHET